MQNPVPPFLQAPERDTEEEELRQRKADLYLYIGTVDKQLREKLQLLMWITEAVSAVGLPGDGSALYKLISDSVYESYRFNYPSKGLKSASWR